MRRLASRCRLHSQALSAALALLVMAPARLMPAGCMQVYRLFSNRDNHNIFRCMSCRSTCPTLSRLVAGGLGQSQGRQGRSARDFGAAAIYASLSARLVHHRSAPLSLSGSQRRVRVQEHR